VAPVAKVTHAAPEAAQAKVTVEVVEVEVVLVLVVVLVVVAEASVQILLTQKAVPIQKPRCSDSSQFSPTAKAFWQK